ncbi:MAG: response regulator transcription factor [Alphaproteobacteria bacterium]|nr:MAG: response regulator transcription factor [Alphaproteobacteria bacterium]
MKVLVVDNNDVVLSQLCELLGTEGYTPVQAKSGEEALQLYAAQKPDFICLDIQMDGISGYEVCRKIRETDKTIPIVFITGKSAPFEKVTGLDIGADDYITKPYDIFEVRARIRAIARRCLSGSTPDAAVAAFSLSNVKVFPARLQAEKNGSVIDLNPREVKLLRLFHDRKGQVLDRDALLDHCWGTHIMSDSRTVDWHISQLRKRIEDDPARPNIIKTVHGAGYKYEDAS